MKGNNFILLFKKMKNNQHGKISQIHIYFATFTNTKD